MGIMPNIYLNTRSRAGCQEAAEHMLDVSSGIDSRGKPQHVSSWTYAICHDAGDLRGAAACTSHINYAVIVKHYS